MLNDMADIVITENDLLAQINQHIAPTQEEATRILGIPPQYYTRIMGSKLMYQKLGNQEVPKNGVVGDDE